MQTIDWLSFWYEAEAAQYGVVLAVSDVAYAKAKLYQARAQSGDPVLSGIQIRVSPEFPEEELWLVKERPSGEKIP